MSEDADGNGIKQVPLVIGVTGHRDIDPGSRRLRRIVRHELEGLAKHHIGNDFTIVSPLAEGADRIVATAALETLDAKLVVPLPLPLDDPAGYTMDFPGSIAAFNKLMAAADETVEAPIRSKGAAWRQYSAARDRQYAWAGAYVAEHCDVMIALWDGCPARGVGGTAHVVRWIKQGRVPRAHSTLLLKSVGSLPPVTPTMLIHIDPVSGDVARWQAT